MSAYTLPQVKKVDLPPLPHFPTRMQAAIFRMWETVKADRIANALNIPEAKIAQIADDMGLPPQKNMDEWESRGYITTIRNLWYILPYDQLLSVLNMTEDKLAEILVTDDFLSTKLGGFKPECEPVVFEELTEQQREQTLKIKNIMQTEFKDLFDGALPFRFFDEDAPTAILHSQGDDDHINMIYSFCGLYANALDNDTSISYPDSLLFKYCEMGINAVWLPAVLYQVTEFPFDPSYSAGYKDRQKRLSELIERAGKFGIKVFLYLNEPRFMPPAFFEKYPEMRGKTFPNGNTSMCTSDPRILEYLKNAVAELCRAVPGIGGFYMINFSENLTHCKSVAFGEDCPKCKDIPPQKLTADVLCAIAEGAESVDPSIKILAYTWVWMAYMGKDGIEELLDFLPKNVIPMCVSEAQKDYCIGGIENKIRDYSMSIPGPGDDSRWIWSRAREKGHQVAAKVQVNTTWESSTVPYMPVYDLICEHMKNLHDEGVENLMLSWTLGGYPSFNLKLAINYLKNPTEETYDSLLKEEYGEWASVVKSAATKFSNAFREFPFYVGTLYHGPQNAGPSTLLYENPTGREATMTCYAFDDLEKWRSIYPVEIFKDQFEKLSIKWAEGLKEIEDMPNCTFKDAAIAAYALFRSSYLQVVYNLNREGGDISLLLDTIKEERSLATLMYEIMLRNNQIGYEAANHYYFNKGMLTEKVLNCDCLAEIFKNK